MEHFLNIAIQGKVDFFEIELPEIFFDFFFLDVAISLGGMFLN